MSIDLTAADWIQIAVAGIAGAAAIAAVIQSKLTKQQMDASLRPWMGVGEESLHISGTNQLTLSYHNFGQLPNTTAQLRKLRKESMIERSEVTQSTEPVDFGGVCYPGQDKDYIIEFSTPDIVQKAENGTIKLFMGIVLRYEFANKQVGEYGVIFEYRRDLKSFVIKDEWNN